MREHSGRDGAEIAIQVASDLPAQQNDLGLSPIMQFFVVFLRQCVIEDSMRKSRLSWYKQVRLIEHFVGGSTARSAAKIVRVDKDAAAYYYHRRDVHVQLRQLKQWARKSLG